jgi:hypothetical protein
VTDQRQHGQNLTPRRHRLLLALLAGQRTREEIDRIAGASNGPDEILNLRQQFALSIPCQRQKGRDRDGHPVQVGIYRLSENDRKTVRRLLASVEALP